MVKFLFFSLNSYRDQWTCGRTEDRCHGVGVGFRQYLSEPPNLLFGRTDHNCDRYVSIDLYNPVSGRSLPLFCLILRRGFYSAFDFKCASKRRKLTLYMQIKLKRWNLQHFNICTYLPMLLKSKQ